MINSELTLDNVIALVTESISLDSSVLNGLEGPFDKNDKDSNFIRKKVAEVLLSCSALPSEIADKESDSHQRSMIILTNKFKNHVK